MNIDYDDVEMQFKVKATFTAKVKATVHKHTDLQDVEEYLINKIHDELEKYMDEFQVEDVERLL
ncbi:MULTISPECIES: hypothetical protein [unclassified Staphylococcus]|uniref:hypothetical protein n=1 Tax=unclassified Staphylococcus TaxID=91994 RepID=UPI0008A56387|nr:MULTISPECIES: hypothetical protein [unclassified Staphylococcus]OFM14619.1 hypothetical protein HMPREF2713_10105 [Staphylococcus sp. HMSC059E03]OFN19683.1 hypothetical protein HMPREF2603_08785 [Staphylococcus sp. HMSC055C03]OFV05738.1 hypothetical protein HMPREF3124_06340 [Staphylococcus sp. HMSC12H08]OHR51897.1 hypothetical protein HMPREF2951_08390 [Staphylococcus sp. HMSC056D08]OHS43533.1 hypothetical protein HMPREF3270_05885 [Staphylococcus sp. HMSC65H10]